jgi:hypothetical protein
MRTRTIESYDRVMSKIIEQNSKSVPDYIIFKHEPAIYNSIKKEFPNDNLSGCLFSLSQILWRKIQTMKLVKSYNKNANFEFYGRMILALAFVLTARVDEYAQLFSNYFR